MNKPFVYAIRIFLKNRREPMAELAFGEGGNPTGETKIIPWDDIKERDKYIINAYTFVWDEREVVKTRSFDEYIDGHNIEKEYGEWISPTVIGGHTIPLAHCSKCGQVPCGGIGEHYEFCPHCGIPMQPHVIEKLSKQPGKCDKTTEGVAIDKTNFPDAYFRKFVRRYDTDNDGYLSDAELAAVTTMNCFGLGIADLKGIEYFTALTYLDCSDNNLTSLDVSANAALTCLDCFANNLTSLDVSHNTALKTLFCDGNRLTSLDVSHNTDLTRLDCFANNLTSLDVSNIPAIRDAVMNGTKDDSRRDYDNYNSEQGDLYMDKTVTIIYKP